MSLYIWGLAIAATLYLYFKQVYSKFSKHGIKLKNIVPLLGNKARVMLGLDSTTDDIDNYYKAFPNERFIGKYDFSIANLMIRDIELVKKVTVKDFEHFVDHGSHVVEKSDPLFGRGLFFLKGQEWKDMRSIVSPTFTSSKIRTMLPLMVEIGEQMNKALNTQIEESGVGYIDVEVKDITIRYASDVIASCVFGVKVDSFTDTNNVFYTKLKGYSSNNFRLLLKVLGFGIFPDLMKVFKIGLLDNSAKHFFRNLVTSTMEDREKRKIIFPPDMIHLLMEAKKGKMSHEDKDAKYADEGFAAVKESSIGKKLTNRVWSQDDLIAQTVFFYLVGLETISTAMTFLILELALNPDVQERLAGEIKENEEKNGGKFDYNSIINMTYLDMVVSETLRLWPPSQIFERKCTKDYNAGKPNETSTKDYIIRKGDTIVIPVWSFHRDPQYFPDPLKFDPERFSEENKHKINPYSYIPFGIGPRNCVGSRFALCKMKVLTYQLLQNMEICPNEKTCISSETAKGTIQMLLKGGHHVRFKKRT